MEIKKEPVKQTVVNKKFDIIIHKAADSKINSKKITTRAREKAINIAEDIGSMGTRTVTNYVEGGENIDTALHIGKSSARTAKRAGSKTVGIIRKQKAISNKTNKLAKKQAKKKAKKNAKKAGKKVAKKAAKETSKEVSKTVTKETTKVAVQAGATAAGSAAGPYGMAIGYAVGEAVGEGIEKFDYGYTQRMRKIKFLFDKLQPQDKQKDSLFKLARDLVVNAAFYMGCKIVKYLLPLLLPLLIIVISIGATVMGIIAVLYNSPLALFLPPLADGEIIHSVTAQLVSGFNDEVQTLIDNHEGADKGRIVYVDYEGTSTPSNYYDIMCVYMIKYGYENTAAEMNGTNKMNLMGVAADMMQHTTKITEETEGKGKNKKKVKYLDVNVTLKTYSEMAITYGFTADQIELLNHMMSQYSSAANATDTDGIGMSNLKGSMTNAEIKEITYKISDPTRKKVAEFVLSKVGFPYSQPNRDSGKAFDCSSLAYYAWKTAGVDISNGGSTTAAAEAQGLEKNTVDEKDIKPGDLIFYSYTTNGRYKNISHVAIYVGSGKIVEAVDPAHGVCIGDYHNKDMVMICRPKKK